MKIFVHPCQKKNIGDELNHWYWNELIGNVVKSYSDEALLVGIGTVLNDNLPRDREIHVMGSGVGYGSSESIYQDNWTIHFVRGHLSAKRLGLEKKSVISDPGILINRLRPMTTEKRYKTSFMPHIGIDSPRYRRFITEVMRWNYISPSEDENDVLLNIAASEKLITSAMHGAILADSYRTPWLPINTSPEILPFKWMDWFSSMNITSELTTVPSYWAESGTGLTSKLKNTVKEVQLKNSLRTLELKGQFLNSEYSVLTSRQEEILNKLDDIQNLLLKGAK
ncbi:polysaccharide pyruvyl transferase family protein [Vibrio sp.]|nr:polysaccharide pyruvyl transferase family protein [Vibrio sp.]